MMDTEAIRLRAKMLAPDPWAEIEMRAFLTRVVKHVDSLSHRPGCASHIRVLPRRACDCGVEPGLSLWKELLGIPKPETP